MTIKGGSPLDPADLRRRAEELLRKKPDALATIPPEEAGRLLHELQVHQIELEMQNYELREAQQEIEASRVKYLDLFDWAPVGYFTVGEKDLILKANYMAAELLGVERNLLLKQPLTRYILPEDKDIYYLHRKRLLETGMRQVFELRMCRQDGSPFWAWLVTDAAWDGEDGLPVYRTTVSDITQRKRAEETARRETSLREVLLDILPCIALVIKKQTREIVACNEIARKYGAVVGKNCYDALAVPGTPCPFCLAPEVWEAGESKQIEVEYMGKFWHGIWIPFSDDLYVHYIFEITDRKRAEIEKEKLQAQLQQSMKMEAVGRLAGGIAHDFNNLLTVITGYSELLLQKIEKESPLHAAVEEIKRAGERAALLTQQLLAFSRKQIIEPKVVCLDLLVAEMQAMLPRLIGEDIALQATTGKDLGSVKIDPGQFQQILMNLVVNARDAMPDGGKIVIETANVDLDEGYCALHPYVKPGRFVMLSVSDTGMGMSEEVKAHIFEPFFTTKERGKGTGLGLAMTYGAVKQSGGSTEVYSEVGIGTTFKIYLPRIEEEAVKPEKDDRPTDLPGGTETILLVEVEDSVRDLCVQILERLGYKVLQAPNGAEAIAVAQEYVERIDLLLTDVVMPEMNGAELATQLVLYHPEIKDLFTSGYTDEAIVRHGVLDEGVSFIGKPYSPSALAKKIREVLDKVG